MRYRNDRDKRAPRSPHDWAVYIFRNTPLGIAVAAPQGKFLIANPAFKKLTGCSLAEVRKLTLVDLAEERDRAVVSHNLERLRSRALRYYALEKRRQERDGTWIRLRVWMSLIPDASRSSSYELAIVEDISGHKRTKKKQIHLTEGQPRDDQGLPQLAEHIREVLWVTDAAARQVLYVSLAFERIWGKSVESVYRDKRSFLDAIHPEDRPRVLEEIEKQILSPCPAEITYRVIRPDGFIRWVEHSSFPVRDTSGGVCRFVGSAQDITERVRAGEDLRRREAHFANSERLGHVGSWSLKMPEREITFWSKEVCRIFGFDPSEAPPALERVLSRIHPEESAARESIERFLRAERGFELDCRVLLPDGSVRHIHSLGHPVRNDAGELVSYDGISMDLTDHRLAEQALRHSREQIRALAARAETIREEERTRLARQIHDELGQLLTGLKMDLKSLMHRQEQARRSKRFQAILESIDEAIHSIRRIATELRPRILDDLGLVAAVEWAVEEFAGRAGMACTLESPSEDLRIDPQIATALYRILQEALTNIARHSEADRFCVKLVQSDDSVSLEVSDNGKGFDETQLAPGESLGLLGMKERAILFGGWFSIRSAPGEGVTVTAWLPARAAGGPGK